MYSLVVRKTIELLDTLTGDSIVTEPKELVIESVLCHDNGWTVTFGNDTESVFLSNEECMLTLSNLKRDIENGDEKATITSGYKCLSTFACSYKRDETVAKCVAPIIVECVRKRPVSKSEASKPEHDGDIGADKPGQGKIYCGRRRQPQDIPKCGSYKEKTGECSREHGQCMLQYQQPAANDLSGGVLGDRPTDTVCEESPYHDRGGNSRCYEKPGSVWAAEGVGG